MKRAAFVLVFCTIIVACETESVQSEPISSRTQSIPEQVETDLFDVFSKDWSKLADTVNYFNKNLLLKGRSEGYGPDSVWYELALRTSKATLAAEFYIEDSLWFRAQGMLYPLRVELEAYSTLVSVQQDIVDSIAFSVNDITVNAPHGFATVEGSTAQLYYHNEKVGYVDIEQFENDDYSTGKYLVVHYDGDNRSFSYYDNGFIEMTEILNEWL